MPDQPFNDPFESALDRLFQTGQPVSADFTARTLARIRHESQSSDDLLDAWIEGELAASRIEPAPGFTERARERIKRDKAPLIRFPFPLFIRTAAGVAAAVALLFAVGRSGYETPQTMGGATVANVEQLSSSPEMDTATATLLMLAEGLDPDARWLLEGGDNAALLALAR